MPATIELHIQRHPDERITAERRAYQRAALAEEIALAAQMLAGLPTDQSGPADVGIALDSAGLSRLRSVLDFSNSQLGDLKFGDVADTIYKTTIHQSPPLRLTPEEQQTQRNRTKLLDLVQRFWVEGLLHTSLHQRVLIELGMQTLPDSVHQPWKHIVCLPGQPPRPLPPGTAIGTVFTQARSQLLILGAPGGGKTTTLLILAEQLIAATQADPALPIPVVFQLSTWAVGKPRLADWLVTELKERYKVPPKLGQAWVQRGEILPLLDGLDEVGPSDVERASCVRAINAYLGDSGAQAVVCSRTAEYAQLDAKLALETAIQIQPLEPTQVDAYLARCGPAVAGLRAGVAEDATLGELAASPLLLSVLALAYRDTPAAALVGQEHKAAYQRLWADYVNRRLALERADAQQTEPEQLRAWLTWLARGMQAHGQQVFYIEYLQPTWLASRGQRWLLLLLSFLSTSIGGGLVVGSVFGLVYGVFVGMIYGLDNGLRYGLRYGLGISLGSSMALGLINVLGNGLTEIKLTETLSWNWKRAFTWQHMRNSFLGGVIGGVLFGLGIYLGISSFFDPAYSASVGILFSLLGSLIYGPGSGLLIDILEGSDIQSNTRTNDGIVRSFSNAWRSSLGGGLIGGLGGSIGGDLIFGLNGSMVFFLSGGLGIGLILGFLQYGGAAVIKHYILRMLLHRRCGAPWDFAAALDQAVSRNLMSRVGGGYRFYHRLLQEHFAAHEAPELPVAAILGPKPGEYTGGRRNSG